MTPEVKRRIEQIRQGIVPEGYKRTKAGIAPVEWEERTLGSIYAEHKEPGSNELPILTVSIHSGVSDGELDEEEIGKKVRRIEDRTQYRKALSGDLVFNMMRAWQGAIGVVRTDGMVSPAYIVATPNKSVYPPFMDYYMKTPQMVSTIHRASYGLTDFRLRLYWDSFVPIRCAIPSVAEQRKIAAILTTQDKVIELKEKLLTEKQRQKKYLMQQLLTGRKRTRSDFGPWKSRYISEIATMHSGGTPNRKIDSYFGNKYVWVSISDMSSSRKYISSSERGLSQEGFDNCSANLYPAGTVLLAMYASIGECVISTTECCSSQAILGIEVSDAVLNEYLYYIFLNHREKLKALGQASSQPNLNKKLVQSITINLPCIKEQQVIVEILSNVDQEIDLLWQDFEQEKKKKKALMQLLLMGIVRVSV